MSPARSARHEVEVIPHGTGRSHHWLVPAILAVLAAGSVACATTVDGAAVADPDAVLTTAVPTTAGPTGAEPAPTAQTSTPAAATTSATAEETTTQPRTPTSATTGSATGPPSESSATDSFPTAATGTSGGPTTGGGITASTITTSLAKLPAPATTFSGKSDWQMEIAKSWKKFDIPGANEEAAWVTGGGSDSFANNVNVLVEKPTVQVGLQQYLLLSTTQIQRAYPDAAVRSSAIVEVDGRQVGRIQYAGLISGVDLDAVAYVAQLDDGWAVATYVTPQGDLTKYAPEVEPYLATLRPGS